MNPLDVDAFHVSVDCGSQKNLRINGVIIPASWWITAEREEKLKLIGAKPPSPIEGHVLLHTGEPHIIIDEYVAQQLKLKPTGKTKEVYSIRGKETVQHYLARLMLPVVPIQKGRMVTGGKFALGIPIEAWSVSTLKESYLEFGYTDGNNNPLNVIGVLGRIFLQFVTMTYNGLTGKIDIRIDHTAMYPQND